MADTVAPGEPRRSSASTQTRHQCSLQFITAPALQELRITQETAASLLDCINRSACSLATLVLTNCSIPDLLIPILAASPNLTALTVVFHRTTKPVMVGLLGALIASSDAPPDVCPRLSRLVMGELDPLAISSLLDVAASRRTPPITFLRAFYNGELTSGALDILPRVAAMKADGLDVAIDAKFKPSSNNYMGFGWP
ncbi:hypothetical protein B0H16DRAFT_1725425 [Mycena metata]|uniref:Uncharacterized protein n=1 Tax=Mycena metata TaxID=1033252 RepID=A0AAD7IT97_9AGAR|nr:hypothetical protein B0H16DRAFT_1725425 [Mycena metata]